MRRAALLAVGAATALAAPATAAAAGYPPPCFEASDARLTSASLRLHALGTGPGQHVHIAAAPGVPGRLFVVERAGRIWTMGLDGRFARQPFLDLSAGIEPTLRPKPFNNERGMQSVAFPPDYARTGRFYVFLSDAGGDTRVMEFRTAPDGRSALEGSGRTLLKVEHSFSREHYGGDIAFGPRRRLYVTLGDALRSLHAQSRRRLYGKIVSLDPRRPRRTRRIHAKGLRNPFRFAFDPFRGSLVIGDVGELSYEEIDVLSPRRRRVANFGWPYYEGRKRHGEIRLRGYVAPRLTYSHRIGTAVIGGRVMRDARIPHLRRRYVYGDLCRGWIATTRLDRRRPKGRRTGLLLPAMTSFGEDAGGRIYVTSQTGTVYRLEPRAASGSR